MKNAAILGSLLFLTLSCTHRKEGNGTLFTLLSPSRTHVRFNNKLTETRESNIIEYLYFNNGAGVAAGDINNDGLIDLFFTSNQNPNALYLNKGNFRFEDITQSAGVGGTGDWKTGVTMADVNGDGLLDIYVCEVGNYKSYHGRNQLFINQGNGTFKEEAHEYGLDFQGFSTQAAFFDYDGDGDLDMYLLNHSVHTSRSYGPVSLRNDFDPRAGDRLYRQDVVNGKPFFHDVTQQAGIYSSQIGYGLGVNICDINSDGYPDVYVSNDFHENDYLYINNGNGTFTERLTDMLAHTSRSSMGNDVDDFNNDGLPDIMVLDMLPDEENIRKQSGGEDDYDLFEMKRKYGYNNQFVRNTLQLNLGGGMFSEIGRLAGVYSTDWSWSPLFCDVDNDGWKDLFITNGIYRRANDLDYIKFLTQDNRFMRGQNEGGVPDKVLYDKMPLYPHVNFLFRNNGDLTFTNKAAEWGFTVKSYSNGATYADLDNDGDLDLVVNNINQPAFIYRNNAEKRPDTHYLSVAFKGKGMNTRGLGARVVIYTHGQQQMEEQFPTRGFLSATSDVLHFGLGRDTLVDSLAVRWPDHTEQVLYHIRTDQKLTLDNTKAGKPRWNRYGTQEHLNLFTPVNLPGLAFRHQEDPYVDFDREKLIPHSLSAEGPPLAVADVNGDGRDDVFVGGAKNQPSALFVQQPDGTFRASNTALFEKECFNEEVDAVFFDADGDGHPDLYLVRGGNELAAGSPRLHDQLLLNDGRGNYRESPAGSLPNLSHNGSCIKPCDFDGDGDIDLFVGSRSVPGAYGWSPQQFLLENDGHGHFRDVTAERAKGLKNVGMVTDAQWLDYDGDGDPDLVVVGEWMNVTLFRNDQGKFTEVTGSAGLGNTSGWWNSITAADLDGDGDIDLVAGNLGLNTILKASLQEPVMMYLSDFDNNGTLDPVICSYMNGVSYPVASVDELGAQVRDFRKKYPRYADFGGKTVYDLFGKKAVDESIVKKAVLLESCVFVNDGKGHFTLHKLPLQAQFSPVRDILVHDVNGDGRADLILVGNDYAVRPSYGRYDASYGCCLLGETGFVYKPLGPLESGLAVMGDARRISPIRIKDALYCISAVNNGPIQVFKVKNP